MSVCGALNLRTKSRKLQPPKAASNKRACLLLFFLFFCSADEKQRLLWRAARVTTTSVANYTGSSSFCKNFKVRFSGRRSSFRAGKGKCGEVLPGYRCVPLGVEVILHPVCSHFSLCLLISTLQFHIRWANNASLLSNRPKQI